MESNVTLGDLLSPNTNPVAGGTPPAADNTGGTPPTNTGTTDNGTIPPTSDTPPTSQVTLDNSSAGTADTTPPAVVTQTPFESLITGISTNANDVDVKDAATQLLQMFGGVSLDATGNMTDKDGKLVLTAEKLQNYLDNDVLPLDAEGNMVNDLGVIIKDANALALDNSVILPVKNAIETNFGITFPQDIDLPDTTEGMINLVNESIKAATVDSIQKFLEAQPELKSFAQHLALGGTADNYTSTHVNYKDIKVKDLEVTAKLDLLRKSFTAQGNPSGDMLVDILKQAGEEELNKATTDAIKFLDKQQADKNAQIEQQIIADRRAEEENINKYWNDVQGTITKGTLGNLNIPIKEREAFFDYLAKPVDDKMNSAESLAIQQETLETQLMMSYLRFKGGDISKLVNNLVKEQKVLTLKERMAKANGVIKAVSNGAPAAQTTNNSTIDITTLLGNNK